MSFKAQLEKDLHAVFFDPAEFGEQVELAGHEGVPYVSTSRWRWRCRQAVMGVMP